MARAIKSEAPGFGSDSFMDVISNVVGILIVLVIVVGVRASRLPAAVVAPPVVELPDPRINELQELIPPLAVAAERQSGDIASLSADIAARRTDQAHLAALIETKQQELTAQEAENAAKLSRASQLQQDVAVAAAYLDRLEGELQEIATQRPKPVTIETYPTPISHLVDGNEVHFQLRDGRLNYIPLEEMLSKLRSSALNQLWKLKEHDQATDVIGPIEGFRMRYTMERVTVPGGANGRGGTYAQLAEWTLIPGDIQQGETIDEALAEGSRFHRTLSRFNPRTTAVTIWVYPESFASFRQAKKELYRLGFRCAARPLPPGQPIAGSPQGSKSSAQ